MRELNQSFLSYDEEEKLERYYRNSKQFKTGGIVLFIAGIIFTAFINKYIGICFLISSPISFALCIYYNKKADNIYDYRSEVSRKEEERLNKNKVKITPGLFTFDEAIKVMVGSEHMSCKAVYDFYDFFKCAFTCIINNIPKHDIELNEKYDARRKISDYPIEHYKGLTAKTVMKSVKDFIAVDTETTGLKADKEDIIELSAIKFNDFSPVEVFHTFLKPRKSIPADATEINHITDNMVENAPEFSQIINDFQAFIKGYPIVAYNAKFDMQFLHSSGVDLSKHKNKIFDVYALAKKFENVDDIKNYKLSSVCDAHNIGDDRFHNASSDALACGLLFIDYVKQANNVENAFALINPDEKAKDIKPFYLKSYKGELI